MRQPVQVWVWVAFDQRTPEPLLPNPHGLGARCADYSSPNALQEPASGLFAGSMLAEACHTPKTQALADALVFGPTGQAARPVPEIARKARKEVCGFKIHCL